MQVAKRWILAALRRETLFLLAALNARASRRELFEPLDPPALRLLPAEAFVYSTHERRALVRSS